MIKLIEYLKPIITTVLIVIFLQVLGLWSAVSSNAQMLLLKTGLLDANIKNEVVSEKFDYGFTIMNTKGVQLSFSDFKGRVVFLNLWATWCGPCRAEMPGIQNLFSKINGDTIQFVMLSIDHDNALTKVESYIQKNNYSFPVYIPTSSIPEMLRVPSIPTTFIIDKEGNILMKEIGTRNYDTKRMVKYLHELARK
jgi:thiol-disulfide isomerase/thioredoxin